MASLRVKCDMECCDLYMLYGVEWKEIIIKS